MFSPQHRVELGLWHCCIPRTLTPKLSPSTTHDHDPTRQPPGAGVRRPVPVCRAWRLHGQEALRLLGMVSGLLGAGTGGARVDHAD